MFYLSIYLLEAVKDKHIMISNLNGSYYSKCGLCQYQGFISTQFI